MRAKGVGVKKVRDAEVEVKEMRDAEVKVTCVKAEDEGESLGDIHLEGVRCRGCNRRRRAAEVLANEVESNEVKTEEPRS